MTSRTATTKRKKVLVAFEFSGRVRDAFEKKGWDAWSFDLQETESKNKSQHIKTDIYNYIDILKQKEFDLLIAHPPCTYTALSGNRWYVGTIERAEAVRKFAFWDRFDIPKRCIEHPVSVVSSQYRKPEQYIQPYEHGHGEIKKTGLWLTNLPKLLPSNEVAGRETKIHMMTPSPTRKNDRSRTYQGIADAMAEQWS